VPILQFRQQTRKRFSFGGRCAFPVVRNPGNAEKVQTENATELKIVFRKVAYFAKNENK